MEYELNLLLCLINNMPWRRMRNSGISLWRTPLTSPRGQKGCLQPSGRLTLGRIPGNTSKNCKGRNSLWDTIETDSKHAVGYTNFSIC